MADIEVIIRSVKDFYKDTPATGHTSNWESLEERLKTWVGDEKLHLVSEKVNIGQVIVVVGQRSTPLGAPLIHQYTLLRFFEMGVTGWHVSVDYDNIDAEEMMHELMNNVKL